jgi:hypothetical protein
MGFDGGNVQILQVKVRSLGVNKMHVQAYQLDRPERNARTSIRVVLIDDQNTPPLAAVQRVAHEQTMHLRFEQAVYNVYVPEGEQLASVNRSVARVRAHLLSDLGYEMLVRFVSICEHIFRMRQSCIHYCSINLWTRCSVLIRPPAI